jgi:hypothetical protein
LKKFSGSYRTALNPLTTKDLRDHRRVKEYGVKGHSFHPMSVNDAIIICKADL